MPHTKMKWEDLRGHRVIDPVESSSAWQEQQQQQQAERMNENALSTQAQHLPAEVTLIKVLWGK